MGLRDLLWELRLQTLHSWYKAHREGYSKDSEYLQWGSCWEGILYYLAMWSNFIHLHILLIYISCFFLLMHVYQRFEILLLLGCLIWRVGLWLSLQYAPRVYWLVFAKMLNNLETNCGWLNYIHLEYCCCLLVISKHLCHKFSYMTFGSVFESFLFNSYVLFCGGKWLTSV